MEGYIKRESSKMATEFGELSNILLTTGVQSGKVRLLLNNE